MPSRLPFVLLMLLAVFAAGFASSRCLERSAQAQTSPFASTVYVPSDGLAFRTFEGRVIARLSYDRRGGVLDLYDADERPSNTLRADSSPQAVAPAAVSAPVRSPRADFGF